MLDVNKLDASKNIRERMTGIEELAGSIKREGLQSPIRVTGNTVCYGHRRLAAYKLLAKENHEKWGKIPAFVSSNAAVAAIDEAYGRLAENVREDLSPIEIGRACVTLRDDYSQRGAAIADRVGLSRSHVSNCMSMVDKIAPAILEAYDAGKTSLTFADLAKLKVQTPEAQLAAFKGSAKAAAPTVARGKGAKGPRKVDGPPSIKRISILVAYMTAQASLSANDAAMLSALRWVVNGGPCPTREPAPAIRLTAPAKATDTGPTLGCQPTAATAAIVAERSARVTAATKAAADKALEVWPRPAKPPVKAPAKPPVKAQVKAPVKARK
jgi:ParB/RepB/Spo0J family partition protein